MKAFDASFLSLALVPSARVPDDPSTGKPVERAQKRIEELIDKLSRLGEKILIPTPALSEFLVLAKSDGPVYLNEISQSSVFKIANFDERSAIEAAAMTAEAIAVHDKRGGSASSWAKVKFDRQIVAVAKVNGAETIYSTDSDVARFGDAAKVDVESVWDLPEPQPEQIDIPYEGKQEQEDPTTEPQPVELRGTGDGPSKGTAADGQAEADGEGGDKEASRDKR